MRRGVATEDQEVGVIFEVQGTLLIMVQLLKGETVDDARSKAGEMYDIEGGDCGELEWETAGYGYVGVIK